MDLFTRHPANPILTVDDLPFPALAVYNPGVAECDGEVVLLLRVEGPDGRSWLHAARSSDGISDWRVDPDPLLAPGSADGRYEELGCEDPRICFLEELGEHIISYTAASEHGPCVALARTRDFRSVTRIGVIFSPPNKDAALFPRRINGDWMILHRPSSGALEHIWTARSPDLIYWGHPHLVLPERGGSWWDGMKVGAGAAPIETERGWLEIYHGVKEVAGIMSYRLGMAVLDLDDPTRVIARGRHPALSPLHEYERVGNGMNVIFTCGALLRDNVVWLYYGAADTCIALATAPLDDLLDATLTNGN